MSLFSTSAQKGFGPAKIFGPAKLLVLGVLVAFMGVFALAGSAKAAPTSMEFTNGQLNLGFAFQDKEILPAPPDVQLAPPPAPATPLPDLWEARDTLPATCLVEFLDPPTNSVPNPNWPCSANPASATLMGDLTGDALTFVSSAGTTAPEGFGLPSGFRFPIMVVPNPLDQSPVPVSIAATGNVTGTYQAGTGAVSMTGPIEARVLTGLATNPLGEYCAIPLSGLTLSTTSNDDFPGVPYNSAQGLQGTGAVTGTFNITDNSTAVGGADCADVDATSKGAGSIWLSNGIATPPECPAGQEGIPPNCVTPTCPEGQTGTPPNCVTPVATKAKITKVKIKGPSKIKVGKKATFKTKITNGGTAKATGVRLKIQGRGIKLNTSVGKIGAGKTRTVKSKFKARKKGKVTINFKVRSKNAGNKNKKKKIRVVK